MRGPVDAVEGVSGATREAWRFLNLAGRLAYAWEAILQGCQRRFSDLVQTIVGFAERELVLDVVVEPGGSLRPARAVGPLACTLKIHRCPVQSRAEWVALSEWILIRIGGHPSVGGVGSSFRAG